MSTRIQLRHDTAANWLAENPVLEAGEFGIALTPGFPPGIKIGDGTTAWNSLDYFQSLTWNGLAIDAASVADRYGIWWDASDGEFKFFKPLQAISSSTAVGEFPSFWDTNGRQLAGSGYSATSFAPAAKGVTNGDSHDHNGGDGAQIDHVNLANIGSRIHSVLDDFLATGWVPVTGSWSYASPTTITVPSGAVSLYKAGNRLKMTNSGTKYNTIIAVADTLLTVKGDGVANAAITAPYFSRDDPPLGFPASFTYTPVLSSQGGTPPTLGNATVSGIYRLSTLGLITYSIFIQFGSTSTYGSGASWWTLSPPLPHAANGICGWGSCSQPAGLGYNVGPVLHGGAGGYDALSVPRHDGGGAFLTNVAPFTWASGDYLQVDGSYPAF